MNKGLIFKAKINKGGVQNMDKVKTTIIIDRSLLNRVKEVAAQDSRSVNSLITKLLKDYVQEQNK